MGSFSMGLAQMVADEVANEAQEQVEVSDEKVEQFVSSINDDDLDRRIQDYIDSKLSNDMYDIKSAMASCVEKVDTEAPAYEDDIDTSEVSDYFNSLARSERVVCAELYVRLKPILPKSITITLDNVLFVEDEPDSLVDSIQNDLDKLGVSAKVVEHKIKHITPCIRIDFESDITPSITEIVSKALESYGYKLQSKRLNSLYFVEGK